MRTSPLISADEWEEKNILFDEKTRRAWPQIAQTSAVAKATRELVLKQFWASHVKDEFDLISARRKLNSPMPLQSCTTSEVGKKKKNK